MFGGEADTNGAGGGEDDFGFFPMGESLFDSMLLPVRASVVHPMPRRALSTDVHFTPPSCSFLYRALPRLWSSEEARSCCLAVAPGR
jgi:hypothetical protein